MMHPEGFRKRRIGKRLFRHAGGQPFYTLETLKALLLFGPADARAPLPLVPA